MLFLNSNAQEMLQTGISYNEATARIEAFKNVEQKIEKEFYKKACCLLDGEDANTPEQAKKQLSIFDF